MSVHYHLLSLTIHDNQNLSSSQETSQFSPLGFGTWIEELKKIYARFQPSSITFPCFNAVTLSSFNKSAIFARKKLLHFPLLDFPQ